MRTFDLAFDLVREAELGRLVSATYPLADYKAAIEHAANAGRRGAVKVAFDLRLEKERTVDTALRATARQTRHGSLMPRPGFVLDVDRSTPPTLFWHGEGFRLEKLPAGRSRVIYPPEPLAALKDIDAAIRHALLAPDRQRPAAGAAVPGHEADDRLRRHLACRCRRCARPTSASA